MTPDERARLMYLLGEIVLNLRSRLFEIENLHARQSDADVTALQERLRHGDNDPMSININEGDPQ